MEFINKIYKTLDDKQGDDIVVLDFRNNSPFMDYFIICTARNNRHAASLIDEIEDLAAKEGVKVLSKSVNKDSGWSLIDTGSVVVHVFTGEERLKYNLEGLWRDLIIKL